MNTTIFNPTDIKNIKANADLDDSHKIQAEKKKTDQGSEEALTHLEGLKSFYYLRLKWSWSIFTFIVVLLIFNMSLTFLVGFGVLDFKAYPMFVGIVATENFAQIIGLAIIVVKFLFDKKDNSAAS